MSSSITLKKISVFRCPMAEADIRKILLYYFHKNYNIFVDSIPNVNMICLTQVCLTVLTMTVPLKKVHFSL